MSSFRIRPRFEQTLDLSPAQIEARIQQVTQKPDSRCVARIIPSYINLQIPPADQHFWSPQLSLSLEELNEQQTLVRGLYGPNPHVWSLFFYGYAALGILGVFCAIIGLSQWTLHEPAWGLWVLAVLGVLAITLYMIAQTGQKLGAAQTFLLHHTYEDAMGNPVEIH